MFRLHRLNVKLILISDYIRCYFFIDVESYLNVDMFIVVQTEYETFN